MTAARLKANGDPPGLTTPRHFNDLHRFAQYFRCRMLVAPFALFACPFLIEPIGKAIAADVLALGQRHVGMEATDVLPLPAPRALAAFVQLFAHFGSPWSSTGSGPRSGTSTMGSAYGKLSDFPFPGRLERAGLPPPQARSTGRWGVWGDGTHTSVEGGGRSVEGSVEASTSLVRGCEGDPSVCTLIRPAVNNRSMASVSALLVTLASLASFCLAK